MIVLAGSMLSNIAIIARNGKQNRCEISSILPLRNAQQAYMDVIDADWILSRLTGKRGEKARLARALGVGTDVISKILSGERRVRNDEIPMVIKFFENLEGSPDSAKLRLSGVIAKLNEKEARLLLATADAILAQRQRED